MTFQILFADILEYNSVKAEDIYEPNTYFVLALK